MAEDKAPQMQATLGLTGLTMNAMALIAPGAFLWLTFFIQATAGNTAPAMWAGIVLALLLCLATAVCYAEMAKLYPGTGSSYYFAEQSFLNHETAWQYARLVEVHRRLGLASVLLDLSGRDGRRDGRPVRISGRHALAELHERFASRAGVHGAGGDRNSRSWWPGSPIRGVNGSTSVNIAINVIQISALLIFSVMASAIA